MLIGTSVFTIQLSVVILSEKWEDKSIYESLKIVFRCFYVCMLYVFIRGSLCSTGSTLDWPLPPCLIRISPNKLKKTSTQIMSMYYRIVLTILNIKNIPASWLSIAISANKDIMKAYPFLLALCRNLISFCYRTYINPKCVTHQVIPCLWGLISFHSHILCQLLRNRKCVGFFLFVFDSFFLL